MWGCRLSNGLTAEQTIIAILGGLAELRRRGVDMGGSPVGRVGVGKAWREALKRRLLSFFNTQPLADSERGAVALALEQFLAAGDRGTNAVSDFIARITEQLRFGDQQREASTRSIVQDAIDASEQQKIDNRRRAIILTVLLMLMQ